MGRKWTIEDMQRIAKEKGGECLSKEYINTDSKLKWKCKEGHEWEAIPYSVNNMGTWCSECSYKIRGVKRRLTIEEMQGIAKKRGGECLSTEYIIEKVKLKWRCSEGHIWEATPDRIKSGSWCPVCSTGVSERICKYIFEKIFEKEFLRKRPEWLIKPNGSRMELDGYNDELGIAFEYQGIQHFKQVNHFHRTDKAFAKQQERDTLKRVLCEKNHVALLEIPYSIEKDNLPKYIIKECKKKGINLPEISLEVFDIKAYEKAYSAQNLKMMREIAKARGGKCLSKVYIENHSKLKWQCTERHEWMATPGHIKSGKWCPHCAGNVKKTIKDMQNLAKEKGGECLSTNYIDARTKLRWKCMKGHEWENTPDHIKNRGQWCPYCAGTVKLTIEEMQEIAKNRGGICLSTEYINTDTKLKWKCDKGHIWEATPYSIKNRGSWCPHCAGKVKKTIEDMQNLAQKHGGECLSIEYINCKTKLQWLCKEGHKWKATPDYIMNNGVWCPICAKNKRK